MARMKVRYMGVTSDFRILSENDLKGNGISVELPAVSPLARRYVADNAWVGEPGNERPADASRDLVWGPHNGHMLELDVDSDFEMLLRRQGHFLLTEVTDAGAERETVAAPTDVQHPGDTQVAQDGDAPEQRSTTERTEDPAVVERPDPAWEAAVARSEAASEAAGEVKG